VSAVPVPEEAEPPSKPALRALATAADFDAVDIEAPIRGQDIADAHDLCRLYEQAFVAAQTANDEPAQVVYRLFAQICSMGLHTSDPGNVWQPLFVLADGSRAPVAEDYRGEPTALLAGVVARIESPSLRARIADIAWSNKRSDGASASAAIEAYCQIVEGLLDGRLKTLYGLGPNIATKKPIHRALQVARFTTKPDRRPRKLLDTFTRLYDAVRESGDVGVFVQLAELALEFGLRHASVIAPELETIAEAAPHGTYPVAVKSAWDLAARLYHSLKDSEARQRCLMGAVEQTLAMRGQVRGAGAEASWVMEALQQLRHVKGQDNLKDKLEGDLRRLQRASLDEMGAFEFDLGIGDTPRKVAEHFDGLSLSEALRKFAMLDHSRDPDQLRADVLKLAKTSPLMAMMPFTYLDDEGRTVTRTPGAPHEGEPDEVWFTHMIDRSESIHRQRTVAACIDPARQIIQARFGISSRHLEAIVGFSPFIPESQKPIMALGFTRLFQRDFMSATYLLIPQLEPCLRHLLKISGADPSKRGDDSTEQDLSLKNIYVRFRPQLEKLLTPEIAWEVDRLFNTRPGPALRHEVAHGQVGAGDCFHPNVYYANWLMYRLCCLFILKDWDQLITPNISE
jgi:hypothetical protein